MEKGTVGSASLPLPAALSGEAEASALTHDPVSLRGACAPHQPGWISPTPWAAPPAPQAWREEAITKVRKQNPGKNLILPLLYSDSV